MAAALFLLLSCLANAGASWLIQRRYPDRPIVPDLLFDILPDLPFLAYLTDPLMILSILIYLTVILRKERTGLARHVGAIGLGYLARAFLTLLTPLGRPTGNLSSYGIFSFIGLKQHGMFPSGHAMLSAAFFFLVDGEKSPGAKRILGLLAAAESAALILSRGHYSIDIAGGVMTAWIAVEIAGRFAGDRLGSVKRPSSSSRKDP
jgi:membrane-associated phospholipid phosphatase